VKSGAFTAGKYDAARVRMREKRLKMGCDRDL
jgi:hypothetical protein